MVFTAGGKFLAKFSALAPGLTDRMMGFYRRELLRAADETHPI